MSAEAAASPWVWLVAWFADHHGQAYSKAALGSALPARSDLSDPATLSRAFQATGLKSVLVERQIKALDPNTLPCLAFCHGGTGMVICSLSDDKQLVTILDPAEGGLAREISARKLGQHLTGSILLIAPERPRSDARLAPETASHGKSPDHWFWAPVRANSSAWAQITVAAFCLNILNLALPIFVMNVYDRVIPNQAIVTLWTLAIGVSIALFLDFLMRLLRANILERLSARVDLTASRALFRQAMDAHILARPGGAAGLAHRIREFEVVRDFFASATFVAMIDLMFIGVFVLAMWFIVGPIAIVPLVGVAAALILAVLAQLPMGRRVGLAQTLAAKRHTVLVETLNGIETVKSVGAEPVMQREWENAVAASSRLNGEMRFFSTFATHGTMAAQQAVSVAIIVWGVFLVADKQITVGALIAANLLAGRVLAPLGAITQTIFRTQHALRSLRSLSEFMKLPGERGAEIRSGLRVTHGKMALDKATFSYPGTEHPALNAVSLSIEPGESVALLGRVGSGKSTMGKLICGMMTPQSGQVLIDGTALSQFDPAELRDGIGYLPQSPDLFTGTIRENLTMGLPDARNEEIRHALYMSGMDAFVDGLSEGLEFFVGERGQRLSGGQKQGLSLARLLLREPKFLFLDEPTNMMDQQMETLVIQRLIEVCESGVAVVIATHRNSLAAMANRFVVLERGTKVLDGPRAEVTAKLKAGASFRVEAR